MKINPKDLKVEAIHKRLPHGSMSTGDMSQGIRVTHLPTGYVAECTEHRHMHKNRADALAQLTELL